MSAFKLAWPALAGYAAVRTVGLLVLYVWAQARDRHLSDLLTSYDGSWYLTIVDPGYGYRDGKQSNLAFFPLLPWLIAAFHALPGLSVKAAAVVVATLDSLAAAWGLFALGNQLHGRRVGVFLAVVWGVIPHAILQSMAYTEALLTALAAWSLYCVFERRWLLAGVLCLVAGLTRPTALSLIAVVGLAALVAIVRRQDGYRPWLAACLAPLGWLGFVAWAASFTGRWDGWSNAQTSGWGTSFDGGGYTVNMWWRLVSGAKVAGLQMHMVSLLLVVSLVLFGLSIRERQRWELLLYSGLILVAALGTSGGFYHSKARHLVPAFALLLPIAKSLARTTRARALGVLGVLLLISSVFGAYLQLVWGRSF